MSVKNSRNNWNNKMHLSPGILFIINFIFFPMINLKSDSFYFMNNSIVIGQEKYHLNSVFEKAVDNRGKGLRSLYGTRNFRVVLRGVHYRGGANNLYLEPDSRPNTNPLPPVALENLCREGFSTAIYLYQEGFQQSPKKVSCKVNGSEHQLEYLQLSAFNDNQAKIILKKIHTQLIKQSTGPIYTHCWNGWHASGFISALALKQFCDWNNQQLIFYWDKNTDGNNKDPAFQRIRKKIIDFKIDSKMLLSKDDQKKYCFSH